VSHGRPGKRRTISITLQRKTPNKSIKPVLKDRESRHHGTVLNDTNNKVHQNQEYRQASYEIKLRIGDAHNGVALRRLSQEYLSPAADRGTYRPPAVPPSPDAKLMIAAA
jgi:hypothetical protein